MSEFNAPNDDLVGDEAGFTFANQNELKIEGALEDELTWESLNQVGCQPETQCKMDPEKNYHLFKKKRQPSNQLKTKNKRQKTLKVTQAPTEREINPNVDQIFEFINQEDISKLPSERYSNSITTVNDWLNQQHFPEFIGEEEHLDMGNDEYLDMLNPPLVLPIDNHNVPNVDLDSLNLNQASPTTFANAPNLLQPIPKRSSLYPSGARTRRFVCHICLNEFTSILDLTLHLRAHNSVGHSLACSSLCLSKQKLVQHMSANWAGPKQAAIHHPTCPAIGVHQSRPSAPTATLLQCGDCMAYYPTVASFEKHMAEVHNVKKYPCQHCDSAFIEGDYLWKHLLKKHPEKYPFNCPPCRLTFQSKDDAKRHLQMAHPKPTFRCKKCGMAVPSKRALRRSCETSHEPSPTSRSLANRVALVEWEKGKTTQEILQEIREAAGPEMLDNLAIKLGIGPMVEEESVSGETVEPEIAKESGKTIKLECE